MTVIVFPGQGSQFVGMSRDFYENFDSAKQIFNLVQDTTGINIKDIIFENSGGSLDITQYTQLAVKKNILFTSRVCYAYWRNDRLRKRSFMDIIFTTF